MGASILKQLQYGVVESGFHDPATDVDVVRRAFDIEFTPSTKVHEYSYDKAGFYGDRKVTGSDSDRLTSSMESELTFKTYLYGYKYNAAEYPGGTILTNAQTPLEPSTVAQAKHFMITAFKHLLGASISSTGSSNRDTDEAAYGTGSGTTAITLSAALKAEASGAAILFNDVNDAGGGQMLRWIKQADTTSGEVNRNITLPAGPSPNIAMFYATTCWSRDRFDELNPGGNQWMYFEYKRDDDEAGYKLFGCRPASAVITSEVNELPTVEWTFKVGHFERDNTLVFQDPDVLHEEDADDPYPAIGMGVFLTANTGAIDFSEEVFGNWTLTIENELSAKMSTNAKHGIADWTLTGQTATMSISAYWTPDMIAAFESQDSFDIDLQNLLNADDTDDTIGEYGLVAINMPRARVDEYPQDSDIEDQLAQEAVFSAQVNYDEGDLAGTSQRNGTAAQGPRDAKIKVAFA